MLGPSAQIAPGSHLLCLRLRADQSGATLDHGIPETGPSAQRANIGSQAGASPRAVGPPVTFATAVTSAASRTASAAGRARRRGRASAADPGCDRVDNSQVERDSEERRDNGQPAEPQLGPPVLVLHAGASASNADRLSASGRAASARARACSRSRWAGCSAARSSASSRRWSVSTSGGQIDRCGAFRSAGPRTHHGWPRAAAWKGRSTSSGGGSWSRRPAAAFAARSRARFCPHPLAVAARRCSAIRVTRRPLDGPPGVADPLGGGGHQTPGSRRTPEQPLRNHS